MPLALAIALAAALASTDSVAVSHFFGKLPLPPQFWVLLSGEGLLNDSVALVTFKVAVAAAVTARFSASEAAISLVTVSARLFGGMLDRRYLRASTRLNGVAMWSMVTLILNGAVFMTLGLEMPQVLQRVEGYSRLHLLGYVALLTMAVFTVRMAWTLILAWYSRRRRSDAGEGMPNFGLTVVAVLCGVRGSLALSATLSLPVLTHTGAELPGRDLAVFLAAGTIATTWRRSAYCR